MSGFAARKDKIVDSTARSTGALSRKVCGGEPVGDDELDEVVDGSWGGVVACVEGVTIED
jgi:hypothetical protein